MKTKFTFKTVEEYYGFMSQGNTFAPEFQDLTAKAKAHWVSEFQKSQHTR